MDTVFTLFWADWISVKRWFASRSVSKILVIILFTLVFSSLTLGIYVVGRAFFQSIASFQTYGEFTADYIIHAAVIIIFWFSLGSSIVSSMGMLLSPNVALLYVEYYQSDLIGLSGGFL